MRISSRIRNSINILHTHKYKTRSQKQECVHMILLIQAQEQNCVLVLRARRPLTNWGIVAHDRNPSLQENKAGELGGLD